MSLSRDSNAIIYFYDSAGEHLASVTVTGGSNPVDIPAGAARLEVIEVTLRGYLCDDD